MVRVRETVQRKLAKYCETRVGSSFIDHWSGAVWLRCFISIIPFAAFIYIFFAFFNPGLPGLVTALGGLWHAQWTFLRGPRSWRSRWGRDLPEGRPCWKSPRAALWQGNQWHVKSVFGPHQDIEPDYPRLRGGEWTLSQKLHCHTTDETDWW